MSNEGQSALKGATLPPLPYLLTVIIESPTVFSLLCRIRLAKVRVISRHFHSLFAGHCLHHARLFVRLYRL